MICFEYEEADKKMSQNGFVYIANGVRCDQENRLEMIVDNFQSNSHQAAVDA